VIKHSRCWPPACPYDRSWSSPSCEPQRHRELTRGRCRRAAGLGRGPRIMAGALAGGERMLHDRSSAYGRGCGWRRHFRAYCERSRPIPATIRRGSISPSSSMPRTGARRRPPSSLRSSNATGPGTTMARASNCCNFSTPGGRSIRLLSPQSASFARCFFLEGGGNSRPAPVVLRRPGATFGADDGSRTRMAEGRGILSPLRLPVSPRPLAAMGFNGVNMGRQAPFWVARGKARLTSSAFLPGQGVRRLKT
jgi:hypothetical protein